jgi:hypothetical protein
MVTQTMACIQCGACVSDCLAMEEPAAPLFTMSCFGSRSLPARAPCPERRVTVGRHYLLSR